MAKRACHDVPPVEAGTAIIGGLTYIVLRCPICHRVRGTLKTEPSA